MKRRIGFLSVCALAGLLVGGCAKSATNSEQSTGGATEAPAAASGTEPGAGGAQAASGDPGHGLQIFNENCASCHGLEGAGGGVGPALKDEKGRKDFKAAVRWIENPKPPMPKLYPQPLSEKDVADVAAYVETL